MKAKTGIPLKRQMSNKYENMLNKIESKELQITITMPKLKV